MSLRRKMAPRPALTTAHRSRSSTSASCRGAALPFVRAAPGLLGHRPSRHPISKTCVAIVGIRRGHASTSLIWAAFAMNPATPLLLWNRPAGLPIRKPILTIVGIRWSGRLGRLPTDVVDPAAPLLLALVPTKILTNCTIVWIDRSHRGRWRCRLRKRPRRRPRRQFDRPCRRRRGRWRGRWRGKRRGRKGGRGLWQSRGRATPANCHTAIILLRLGPHVLDHLSIPHAHA